MYSYNSNAAYDFSRFETDENAAKKSGDKAGAREHIKLHKTSAARAGSRIKTLAVVGCASIIAFLFINSKAMLSEVSIDISNGLALLDEAKNENAHLRFELEGKVTLSKVDEIATTALGLQKTVKTQVRYISVYDRTMVQAAKKSDNAFERLKRWLDGAAEYLGF